MKTIDPVEELKKSRGDKTLADLASEVGCKQSYLSDVLNGHRKPGPKILKYLGIKKAYIKEEEQSNG